MKKFSSDIRIHSRNHLEIKTNIPVTEPGKEKYYLQLYIFSPAQLNINKKKYVQESSYLDDITVHTRFSSPNISLDNLTDPECRLSPLRRIKEILANEAMLEQEDAWKIIYEIQTLMNNYRTDLRNSTVILAREAKKNSAKTICRKKLDETLSAMQNILSIYRNLYTSFLDARISDELRTAFAWGDETLSIITSDTLVKFFKIAEKIKIDEAILKDITEFSDLEEAYKKEHDYTSHLNQDIKNIGETIIYRRGMLKKWSQSALYMNSEESKTPRRIGHIVAGFAAAAAMTFATLAAIFAQRFFLENTVPWAVLIILAYVFKDRIKEVLREILGKLLPRLIADHITRFRDPATSKNVGNAKEHYKILSSRDISTRIQSLRYEKPNPFRKIMPEENVLLYSRYIKINSKELKKNHSRLASITEIIRFRIDKWLQEMDDPEEILYRLKDGKPVKVKGEKVYHLHLIIDLKTQKDRIPDQIVHYKLILNKKGLLRIQTLN